MKKIKKFKIKVTPFLVEKQLKILSPEKTNSHSEEEIKTKIDSLQEKIVPACIYETFPREKLSEFFSGQELSPSPLAGTLFVVTLFSEEKNYPSPQSRHGESPVETSPLGGEGMVRGYLEKAIIKSFSEQAEHFVWRLVNEEAKKENCFLETALNLFSKKERKKVFDSLDLSVLGLTKEDLVNEQPGLSLGIIPWFSQKKTTKK